MKEMIAVMWVALGFLAISLLSMPSNADEVDQILQQWQAWDNIRQEESYIYNYYPRNDAEHHRQTMERLNQRRIADELYRQNWLLERGVRK